jgi:SagB-type dehydrogenase family enzyme
MVKRYIYILYVGIVITAIAGSLYLSHTWKPEVFKQVIYEGTEIKLPQPRLDSEASVEEVIYRRRSIREYAQEALSLEDVSQLLWAAQGITESPGFRRTAPSAGGTYPLEVYLVAGKVAGLGEGVYHYNPEKHSITRIKSGDFREELQEGGLNQEWIGRAAVNLVFTAVYERTTQVYGERGVRYVHLEAGHAAQNVYLQAVSLDLGTVTVGAFDDKKVLEVLNATEDEVPLYIMPVGKQ